MQIKKFVGPTLKVATEQMKEELGNEAIILGSRMIEDISEFSNRKMFEITVGYDEITKKAVNMLEDEPEVTSSFADEISLLTKKIYPAGHGANALAKTGVKSLKIDPDKPLSYPPAKEKSNNQNRQLSVEPKLSLPIKNKKNLSRPQISVDEELKDISDLLAHREISKNLISVIMNQLELYRKFLDSSNIDNYVLSSIASMTPTKSFELYKSDRPKVVSVVGPTGVGKTTCIAKLAVIAKILHNLDVGLISVDTYRLGAIDQLRIFSEISNIEMLVAYEPDEMQGYLNSFKNKDIVFIDTAGRSQKNTEHLEKTKMFLNPIKIDETFLVLSSTSSTKNIFDTAEKFKLFNYNSFIFSKIDEGIAFGNILNTVTNFNIPLTFLSNGQVIPDDIISADSEFIANLIYTGKIGK